MQLGPATLGLIADRFKALGEANRLAILLALREGERSVSELMDDTGLGQANLSKHLAVLHRLGYVQRRREAGFVVYAIVDDDVFRLCDLMSELLEREARGWTDLLR